MLEVVPHLYNRTVTNQCAILPTESRSSSSSSKQTPQLGKQDPKQKSQLCRSFMEYGFCAYSQRCKFAHGLHELLANQQANRKYKTKECENFKKHLYCIYGQRCNFIHVHEKERISDSKQRKGKQLHVLKREWRGRSRLLELLGIQE